MKVLVTGGGGFLGQALCRRLVERGFDVTSFNRGTYPALEALGVRQVQGDLADRDAVLAAAAGVGAIFHNAAKAGAWGSYDSYHRANVIGTRNVIDACRAHGIARLVYTSTPSVTHRATHPVEGGTADGNLYTEQVEPVFDTHPDVARTALVGVGEPGAQVAVLCVEMRAGLPRGEHPRVLAELQRHALGFVHAAKIGRWLVHPAFPVDIRHNAKIGREKLAAWAAGQLAKGRGRPQEETR